MNTYLERIVIKKTSVTDSVNYTKEVKSNIAFCHELYCVPSLDSEGALLSETSSHVS